MGKKHNEIRQLLIKEAARIMYHEGVKQFLDAKRIAAKRILGKQAKLLPSNGEIADELHRISCFHEPKTRQHTLFNMRTLALEVMEQLDDFSPRLIGSVSTGRIRKGSDIDIHIFCDDLEILHAALNQLHWLYQCSQVTIKRNDRLAEYTHIYLDLGYPVELSVYPSKEIRITGRSSTDGRPIVRLSATRLRMLLEEEHAREWQRYIVGDSS